MKTAVLLMAHGSPNSLDEVEPYLQHVMSGRKPTPALVEAMRERYRLIGGCSGRVPSPLLEITRAQAKALSAKLQGLPVFVGMRHWHPFIEEVVREMAEAGITRIVALCMTPYYSRMTVGAYLEELEKALKKCSPGDASPAVELVPVRSWHGEPKFIDAWVERIEKELGEFPMEVRAAVTLLFTAHSLPEEALREEDPYPRQVQETVQGILKCLPNVKWDFAYQSRSTGTGKWLDPDVDSKLQELHQRSVRHVLVVPVGFVCDHVETLYDLDILHHATAKKLGMEYRRTESLNTRPLFIEALAETIRQLL